MYFKLNNIPGEELARRCFGLLEILATGFNFLFRLSDFKNLLRTDLNSFIAMRTNSSIKLFQLHTVFKTVQLSNVKGESSNVSDYV